MIDLIIYSKDRACQLELLLRSIKRFCPDLFNIGIIYKASNEQFQQGYTELTHEYPGWWLGEQHYHQPITIRDITKIAMVRIHTLKEWNDWTMFSTDDQVFFKSLPLSYEQFKDVLPQNDGEIFSFRLGHNTIEQDIHRGTRQPPLNIYVDKDNHIEWCPFHYHPQNNYGYPLAVDCHVFRTSFVDKMLKLDFKSTNMFETNMQEFRRYITKMKSFKESICVNIPANNLSGCTIAGQTHGYSPEWLNKQFLAGKRIALDTITKTKIVGCHQEIKLEII